MKDEGYSPFSVLHLRLNPTYSPGGACVRELLVLGRFSVLDVNNFFLNYKNYIYLKLLSNLICMIH